MTTRATESSATASIRRASPQTQRHAGLVRVHVLVGAELRCLEAGVEGVRHVRLAAPDAEIEWRSRCDDEAAWVSAEPYRPAQADGAGIAGGSWRLAWHAA